MQGTGIDTRREAGPSELRAARRLGRSLLWWTFLFSIFVNLLVLTGPIYMLQVYDRVLPARAIETLVALSLLMGLLYALMAVLDYARGRLMARVGARFQSALDARVFAATLRRASNPADQAAGAAALRDLDGVQRLFVSPVLLALMDAPWTPLFIGMIFVLHPMLGWLALGGAGVLVALTALNQLLTARRTRMALAAEQAAQTFATQASAGTEVVLTQGMGAAMTDRYLRHRTGAQTRSLHANDWTGSFSAFTKAFRLFLQSAVLGLGAYYVLLAEMSPGGMIASSILLGRGLAPVEQLLGQWPVVQRAWAGWAGLGAWLARVPKEPLRTALPVPKAELSVRNLTLVPPGADRATLRGISFEVKPGQALGVIGRSGSGKSSLARALLGYWAPAAGEVRLGGPTIDQYDPNTLGRHIGYLPQSVTLFSGTISENIARMSGAPEAEAVVRAAKRANAHDMIVQLPKGYDTWIDGNENTLSGGQRQRIALARALYGDPVVLILDEPNSALDAEGSDALNRTVHDFKTSGRAVVIMTHRPMAIAECDLLLVLEGGTAGAFGPRDEVLEQTLQNASLLRRGMTRTPAAAAGSTPHPAMAGAAE